MPWGPGALLVLISPVFRCPACAWRGMSLARAVTRRSTTVRTISRCSTLAACCLLVCLWGSHMFCSWEARHASGCYSRALQKLTLWLSVSGGGCLLPTFLFWEATVFLGETFPGERVGQENSPVPGRRKGRGGGEGRECF